MPYHLLFGRRDGHPPRYNSFQVLYRVMRSPLCLLFSTLNNPTPTTTRSSLGSASDQEQGESVCMANIALQVSQGTVWQFVQQFARKVAIALVMPRPCQRLMQGLLAPGISLPQRTTPVRRDLPLCCRSGRLQSSSPPQLTASCLYTTFKSRHCSGNAQASSAYPT